MIGGGKMGNRIVLAVLMTTGILVLGTNGGAEKENNVIRFSANVVSSCGVSMKPLLFDRNLRLREMRGEDGDEDKPGNGDGRNRGNRSNDGKHDDVGTINFNWKIRVKCNRGQNFRLVANAGENFFSQQRHMTNDEGEMTGYRLFKRGRSGEEWGDGDFDNTYPFGTSISGIGNGRWKNLMVHGNLIRNDGPLPGGILSDNIKVSVHN